MRWIGEFGVAGFGRANKASRHYPRHGIGNAEGAVPAARCCTVDGDRRLIADVVGRKGVINRFAARFVNVFFFCEIYHALLYSDFGLVYELVGDESIWELPLELFPLLDVFLTFLLYVTVMAGE